MVEEDKEKENNSEVQELYEISSKLPIRWKIPDSIITRFASNMVVQTMEDYFKISFFEIKPEIRVIAPSELPTEIEAECVASIIVTPNKFALIVEVLQNQLNKYKSKQAEALKKEASIEP